MISGRQHGLHLQALPVVNGRMILLWLLLALSACAPIHPPAPEALPAPRQFPDLASRRLEVVTQALAMTGQPYRLGGMAPGGFDCSGLIGYVYRGAAGIALPRTTREMNAMRSASPVRRDALQAGDLLFFATSGGRRVSHAAIYVGEGRFVHAPSSGGTVRLDSLSNSYWQKNYLNARRVLNEEQLALNP